MLTFIIFLALSLIRFATVSAQQLDVSLVSKAYQKRDVPVVGEGGNPLVECPPWPNAADGLFFPNGCIVYKDVIVEGARAEIWRDATLPSPKADNLTGLRLQEIHGRVSHVLTFYTSNLKPNLKKNLAVKLTMTHWGTLLSVNPKLSTADALATSQTGGTPCHVVMKINPQNPIKWVAHVVAHELYHCVQYQEHPDRPGVEGQYLWIIEGSAKFFEYLQYSSDLGTTVKDENSPHYYTPSTALYLQNYQSSLFFHFLQNARWPLSSIDKWVSKRELKAVREDEQTALADDSAIANAFSRFAVAFHDKKIYFDYKTGIRIVTENHIVEEAIKEINLPTEGSNDELELESITSWTFKKYSVRLLPKQTISVGLTLNTNSEEVVIWLRSTRQGKKASRWSKLVPKLLHSGCGSNSITYDFLVVPISKENEVRGALDFRREKGAKCSCPVKKPAGGTTKRAPMLDAKNMQKLDSRQAGNHSETCLANLPSVTSGAVSSSILTPEIADIIESIMGMPYNHEGTPVQSAMTACGTESKESSTAYPTPTLTVQPPIVHTLALTTFDTVTTTSKVPLSEDESKSAQTLTTTQETFIQQSVTPITLHPTPSSTPGSGSDTPGDEIEDEEPWDGSYPLPEGSPAEGEQKEAGGGIDDDEITDGDDDESCGMCLAGQWIIDEAGMEARYKKFQPFWKYNVGGFKETTVRYFGTYKITFTESPSFSEGGSAEILTLHEVFTEENTNTRKRPGGLGDETDYLHTSSTTTIDGFVIASDEVPSDDSEGPNYVSGSIAKDTNLTKTSEIRIALNEPIESVEPGPSPGYYGPLGAIFEYNCNDTTLEYLSSLGDKYSYVFHRA